MFQAPSINEASVLRVIAEIEQTLPDGLRGIVIKHEMEEYCFDEVERGVFGKVTVLL